MSKPQRGQQRPVANECKTLISQKAASARIPTYTRAHAHKNRSREARDTHTHARTQARPGPARPGSTMGGRRSGSGEWLNSAAINSRSIVFTAHNWRHLDDDNDGGGDAASQSVSLVAQFLDVSLYTSCCCCIRANDEVASSSLVSAAASRIVSASPAHHPAAAAAAASVDVWAR